MNPENVQADVKSISFQERESSETKENIRKLGELLIKEFSSGSERDTLLSWMTHYLAEQMRSAENASGEAKIQAQENCFKTILEIWDHRSSLPNGCRPFETFESIFRALERLDPENTNPYLEIFQRHAENSGEAKGGAEMDPRMQWLDVAFEIDRAARVWIDVVIKQAARNATDEKTKAWIKNSRDLKNNEQTRLILQLVGDTAAEDENGKRRQVLKDRIRQLKGFAELSKTLVAILEEELSLEQT